MDKMNTGSSSGTHWNVQNLGGPGIAMMWQTNMENKVIRHGWMKSRTHWNVLKKIQFHKTCTNQEPTGMSKIAFCSTLL